MLTTKLTLSVCRSEKSCKSEASVTFVEKERKCIIYDDGENH